VSGDRKGVTRLADGKVPDFPAVIDGRIAPVVTCTKSTSF
jgi:hypothetical protein